MTEAQRAAIESADPTISYVARSLEFAPSASHALKDELRGYRSPEGHFMCTECVARMLARGCMLPRRSTPIWNSDMAPTPDCIGAPFHISTEIPTSGPVEVDRITEQGMTQRLSRSVRVF